MLRMLRPQLCWSAMGRMWPGPGVRGAGKLLWVGGSFAGGRVGFLGAGAARLAGGPVGAGDIPFEESKRQTDKIMQCRDVRALAEIVAELGWRFSHVNVNTAWLMLARLRPGEEDGVVAAALQTCTPKVLGEMDGRQLANLLHSAATLHDSGRPRADDELVEKMASRSLEVLRTQPKSFNEQAVANLMWALAKLGVEVDPELVKMMQSRAIKIAADFNSQEVSNLMWALAKLGVKADPELVKVMQGQAIKLSASFNSQDVANLMWALAKLGVEADPELVEVMIGRAITISNDFNSQGVSNLMWALAKLGVEVGPELVKVMQSRAIKIAADFNSQGVANLMWALATLGVEADPELVKVMQGQAIKLAASFNSQEVSNLMWALAKLGVEADPELVEVMIGRAITISNDFNSQEVSNLMWALAKLGVEADPEPVKVMQSRAIKIAADFNSQGVANLMWALATLGVEADPELVEVMQGRAITISADFNAQEVANLMWALAKLGVEADPELVDEMIGRAIKLAASFNSQGVANLMWACTCFDLSAVESTAAFFDCMAARVLHLTSSPNPSDHFNVCEKSQIGQWLLSCRIDDSLRGRLLESGQILLLKEKLGKACRAALPFFLKEEESLEEQAARKRSLRLQEDVYAALKRTFPEMEITWEFRSPTSGYSIDTLVRPRNRREGWGGYAVEVDGPTHFLKRLSAGEQRGETRTPNGSTKLKRKQLRQLKYTVVPVPFWEWNDLVGDQAKEQYLKEKFGLS